ncbi:MAG: carbon-nitrogen hydrolase family protein [Thermodesulfobacteriota bacterium]
MRVAAVQMTAALGDGEKNIRSARHLAGKAFVQGAELVILPEFFPSAMGFHPVMNTVAEGPGGPAQRMLHELAAKHNGIIGGSLITKTGRHHRNTFFLVFPDRQTFRHDKDQPTMWENCYYRGGSDDGVLHTPVGDIGVAMCWELVRSRTVRRLINQVDLIVSGSCWWSLPEKRLPGFSKSVEEENRSIMAETPARFARLTGCPVIHAAHAGTFHGQTPLLPGFPYDSFYLGETQIVDATGTVLARMKREEGEGFVMADIAVKRQPPSENLSRRFWIADLPAPIRLAWWYQNFHGKWYYRYRRLIKSQASWNMTSSR